MENSCKQKLVIFIVGRLAFELESVAYLFAFNAILFTTKPLISMANWSLISRCAHPFTRKLSLFVSIMFYKICNSTVQYTHRGLLQSIGEKIAKKNKTRTNKMKYDGEQIE